MKSVLLVSALLLAGATCAFADGLYWVVGNRASGRCEIVTSNPVIIGDIWFGDGPYKSMSDAKLARSTIRACPQDEPPKDEPSENDNENNSEAR